MHRLLLVTLVVVFALVAASSVLAADMVTFEPVRAPSKGSESAPVTIVEIADFM